MNKNQLPAKIHIPCVTVPGRGYVDLQVRYDNDCFAIVVWGNGDTAMNWLKQGGFDLWKNSDPTVATKLKMGGSVLVREDTPDALCSLFAMIDNPDKRFLHFEPDTGKLLAPPERRICVK